MTVGMKENGIPERIKSAMADMALRSAGELARASGIAESTVRAYISGTRTPPLHVCDKIGRAIGVSGRWLFYSENERDAVATPSELIFAAAEEAFLVIASPAQTAREVAGVIHEF